MLHDDVIVLASGPSVRDYNIRDLEKCGFLIAVNASALYSKPNIALTMDRRAAEYCYPAWQVQGVPEIWIREGIAKNFAIKKNTRQFACDIASTKLELEKPILNASNSGTAGLMLAARKAKKRIFLLGFDMQRHREEGDPYWHPAYPWNLQGATKNGKLQEWAAEFADIAAQMRNINLQVYNVNHMSKITVFPTITYNEFRNLTL